MIESLQRDVLGPHDGRRVQLARKASQEVRALMTDIVTWCAQGKLSAHVHAVYPLTEITAALKAISDRKVMGNLVTPPLLRALGWLAAAVMAAAAGAMFLAG